MDKLVKIEVFGVKDGVLSCNCNNGECNCSGDNSCDCSSSYTLEELYGELVNFLRKSDVKDNIDISFIDLIEDETDKYDRIKDLLDRGFDLPFIFINDTPMLYGSISSDLVYEYVADELQSKNQ